MAKEVTQEIILAELKKSPLATAIKNLTEKHGSSLFSSQIDQLTKEGAKLTGGAKLKVEAAVDSLTEADEAANVDLYREIAKAVSTMAIDAKIPLLVTKAGNETTNSGGKRVRRTVEQIAKYEADLKADGVAILAHLKKQKEAISTADLKAVASKTGEVSAALKTQPKGSYVKVGAAKSTKYAIGG